MRVLQNCLKPVTPARLLENSGHVMRLLHVDWLKPVFRSWYSFTMDLNLCLGHETPAQWIETCAHVMRLLHNSSEPLLWSQDSSRDDWTLNTCKGYETLAQLLETFAQVTRLLYFFWNPCTCHETSAQLLETLNDPLRPWTSLKQIGLISSTS